MSFAVDWRGARVNPGSKLTVRLERQSEVDWPPDAQQMRRKLGRANGIGALIGDCHTLQLNPIEAVSCGEWHNPVVVTATSPVLLGRLLPESVTVASADKLVSNLFPSTQTWRVTGVRYDGIATAAELERARREQETRPEPNTPGANVATLGLALLPVALIALAFTDAGQAVIERVADGG